MERQPVAFMQRELPEILDDVRGVLGGFVGADPADLAFVTNATSGVNAVLRSLQFEPGDELLVTDHAYPACRNAVEFVARRTGATIKVAHIPLQSTSEEIADRLIESVGDRTRLTLIDHVSSATAVVFPVERIVRELAARDVDALVDGAHAPGMVPVHLEELGAAYYTGNCHKWMCAPKGAAFLHVRPDRQDRVVPPVISHGYDPNATAASDFQQMFAWTGTTDPTAAMSIGVAIETIAGYHPGGWPGVMKANRNLVSAGASLVAEALGNPGRTPAAISGSMVSFELPPGYPEKAAWDPLQDRLLFEYQVEVPIIPWPHPPRRLLRISAQLYNDFDDYRALAAALQSVL